MRGRDWVHLGSTGTTDCSAGCSAGEVRSGGPGLRVRLRPTYKYKSRARTVPTTYFKDVDKEIIIIHTCARRPHVILLLSRRRVIVSNKDVGLRLCMSMYTTVLIYVIIHDCILY